MQPPALRRPGPPPSVRGLATPFLALRRGAALACLVALSSLIGGTKAVAAPGFGTLVPESWLVVNTDLTTPATYSVGSPNYFCNSGSDPYTTYPNDVGCIDQGSITTDGFTLTGTIAGGTIDQDVTIPGDTSFTTTLNMTNSDYRPWRLIFNWSFDTDDNNTDNYGSILVSNGYITPNGVGNFIDGESASGVGVYLPAGATLAFKITTPTNNGSPGVFAISGFDATPIPAPLPAAGAGAAFGFSRRLRRRIAASGTTRSRGAIASPGAESLANVALLRARQKERIALNHYSALLSGPVAGRPGAAATPAGGPGAGRLM